MTIRKSMDLNSNLDEHQNRANIVQVFYYEYYMFLSNYKNDTYFKIRKKRDFQC